MANIYLFSCYLGVLKKKVPPLPPPVMTLEELSSMVGKPITGKETILSLIGSALTDIGVAALAWHCPKLKNLFKLNRQDIEVLKGQRIFKGVARFPLCFVDCV